MNDDEPINYSDPWEVIQAAYDALFSQTRQRATMILHRALTERLEHPHDL